MVKNRFSTDDFISKIKKVIREKNIEENIGYIPLFTLEVAILESSIKRFNSIELEHERSDKYFNSATLGRAIDDFEMCGKFRNPGNYRIKKLHTKEYKKSFILACGEINKLRNKLYHKLYPGCLDPASLFNEIKLRLELVDTGYKIEYENLLSNNRKFLADKDGELSPNWTIEMLIYIFRRYYIPYKLCN